MKEKRWTEILKGKTNMEKLMRLNEVEGLSHDSLVLIFLGGTKSG